MDKIISRSLANAAGLVAYVAFAAVLMTNGSKIFGKEDGIVTGVIFLLFFIFSALASSLLVLGKPVMMYMDGQKKEGVKMLLYTTGWIFAFFVLIGIIRFVTKN